MSLDRIVREQVYQYKRKKHLKNKRRGITSQLPKSDIHFMVMNTGTGIKPDKQMGRVRRRKKNSNFYGVTMGAKEVAGVACMILGGVLLLTTCFSKEVTEAATLSKEPIQVGEPINTIVQNESNEVITVSKGGEKQAESEEKELKGDYERYYEVIQDFEMQGEELQQIFELSMKDQREFAHTLSAWSIKKLEGMDNKSIYKYLKKYNQDEQVESDDLYIQGLEIYKQFIYDVKYFPIVKHKDYSFEQSWKESSLFEEKRLHYGVDIIDPKNSTGKVPIISMTNGVIENVGWNDTGGYRVGIRSTGGAYFYYAHLSELPTHLKKGDAINAGEYIGLMGNTGYGKEGTSGKVPVHLHIGIAVKNKEGKEFWINPYPVLQYIESSQIMAEPID